MTISEIPLIKFENLTKDFGQIRAVDNLNLEVYEGEIIGLVGPNGAGKTTVIKMLANILTPSQGRILLKDKNNKLQDVVSNPNILNKSGFLIDIPSFYEGITAYELLKYFAKLQNYPKNMVESRIDEVLQLIDLFEWKHQKVKIFSKGMKQKLGLAQALIHDPQIVVLDEPQIGLDPKARVDIRNILKDLQKNGKTIFLASHMLYEISEVCDKIALINRGILLEFDKISELEKKLPMHEIKCLLLDPIESEYVGSILSMLEDKLKSYLVEASTYTNQQHHILYDPSVKGLKILYDGKEDTQNKILTTLIKETNLKITSFFTPKTYQLESIYMALIKRDEVKRRKDLEYKNQNKKGQL